MSETAELRFSAWKLIYIKRKLILCHFQKVDSHRITVKTTIVQCHHNIIVVEKTSIPPLGNKTLNKELVLRLSKTTGFDISEQLFISKAAERKSWEKEISDKLRCLVK